MHIQKEQKKLTNVLKVLSIFILTSRIYPVTYIPYTNEKYIFAILYLFYIFSFNPYVFDKDGFVLESQNKDSCSTYSITQIYLYCSLNVILAIK